MNEVLLTLIGDLLARIAELEAAAIKPPGSFDLAGGPEHFHRHMETFANMREIMAGPEEAAPKRPHLELVFIDGVAA